MADEVTPVPVAPSTEGAVTEAPETHEGQAGGSPPPEANPTSGGDDKDRVELRRKVTEQSEEVKNLRGVLGDVMRTPEWAAIEARLSGKPVAPAGPDPDAEIFSDDPTALAKGKAWKAALKDEVRKELLRDLRPMVQEFGNTKEERAIKRALGVERLTQDAAFDEYKADFEAENPTYRKLMGLDANAAANWLVSKYSIHTKRNGRTPVADRADATLERGGGSPARVGSAASTVKIARNDPDKIHKMLSAFEKGETPVDENGNPYRTPR